MGASDSNPFWEPGEHELMKMFDVGLRPNRIFHRHRFLSIVSGAAAIFQDNQTPFDTVWIAGDKFTFHRRGRLKVRQPSVLLFGIGSPSLDDTTSTQESALAEAEWPQLKYGSLILERAMTELLGLTEAGSETPWVEATSLLLKHLEPDVFEETSGAFITENYNMMYEMVVDHSVVGEFGKIAISSGR